MAYDSWLINYEENFCHSWKKFSFNVSINNNKIQYVRFVRRRAKCGFVRMLHEHDPDRMHHALLGGGGLPGAACLAGLARQKKVMRRFFAAAALAALALPALAANTPCSGKKGGISHCASGKFVCNDGSISASKKMCTAPGNPAPASKAAPKASTECDCRSGTFCTGPRGGTFCYTDSGKKTYMRK